MTTKNLLQKEKNAIVKKLESIIRKHGVIKVRLVANHYFKNMKEFQKTQKEIKELEERLSKLKKK